QGQQVLDDADLLVGDQDDGVVQHSLHLVGVGDHIGAQVAAVELHAFHDLAVGLGGGLVLLDGDDAVGGDLLHGLGDQAADLRVARRDGAHAGDVVAVLDLLAVALDGLHSSGDSLAHAAADVHGVGAGGHVLHAFGYHGLGQDGGGGGAVAGGVVGLGGDFLHQLGAHVLKRVLQLDLLGDGHAVVGDDGCAVLLVQHDVAALGAQGDLDGVGQRINAGAKCLAGVLALFDLFCHKVSLLFLLYMRRFACRGMVRSCSGRAAYSSTM